MYGCIEYIGMDTDGTRNDLNYMNNAITVP
jgi:hypothetical protein